MIPLNLEGKVTIVTGGARGIGKSIALRFAEAGSDVAIFDVLDKRAEETVGQILSLNKKGNFYKVDVTRENEVNESVNKVLRDYGKIDFLVNNAGITSRYFFTEIPVQIWKKTIDVNLTGAFLCCKAVVPSMIKQKE
ncbi:SDR family NAD(P)-dependent oxidoreductase, partial [Candidatus Aerophobetes bacterium]|nr:SDR family NAD(P)-dependent oxidoreductase [Candidatus Aerophobetes bacterium]